MRTAVNVRASTELVDRSPALDSGFVGRGGRRGSQAQRCQGVGRTNHSRVLEGLAREPAEAMPIRAVGGQDFAFCGENKQVVSVLGARDACDSNMKQVASSIA